MAKIVKPTTPGRRKMSYSDFSRLTKKSPEKSLLSSLKKTGGRNNQGRITCRHRGGGAKRAYRQVDFTRTDKLSLPGIITALEYDPNRTAFIALVKYPDGDKRYHLASEKSNIGDEIVCAPRTKIRPGNRLHLKNVPVGFEIYNISLRPNSRGVLIRSAGSSARVMGFDNKKAQIQMPSGEIRYFEDTCYATIGKVSNEDWQNIRIGKAGRIRHLGRRPHVRGKAMNPVDHPHGGGEGGSPIGLKHPKTPWGMPALGVKTRNRKKSTNRYIIRTRRGRTLIKQ